MFGLFYQTYLDKFSKRKGLFLAESLSQDSVLLMQA